MSTNKGLLRAPVTVYYKIQHNTEHYCMKQNNTAQHSTKHHSKPNQLVQHLPACRLRSGKVGRRCACKKKGSQEAEHFTSSCTKHTHTYTKCMHSCTHTHTHQGSVKRKTQRNTKGSTGISSACELKLHPQHSLNADL